MRQMGDLEKMFRWAIGILLCGFVAAPPLHAKDELQLELIGGSKNYPVARYTSETPDGNIVYGIWEFDCAKKRFRNLKRGTTPAMLELRVPDAEMQDGVKGTVEWTGMAIICNISEKAWEKEDPA
jgi:hypothetical protein